MTLCLTKMATVVWGNSFDHKIATEGTNYVYVSCGSLLRVLYSQRDGYLITLNTPRAIGVDRNVRHFSAQQFNICNICVG